MAVLMAIVGFLEAIAWPLVVGIALIMFRKPLSHFFQELGPRITKVSIAQIVTTELSIPETVQPKLDQLLPALQKLNSGEYTSNITVLFQQIATAEALDCLVVDLESGWLTSRLFLFTIMFRRTRGTRCVVFLETCANVNHRFLGTASPNEVQLALAQQYPWLEEAWAQAQLAGTGTPDTIITSFLQRIQKHGDQAHHPDPSHTSEWEFLEKGSYWERANWISRPSLERDLGSALHKDSWSWLEDSPDLSRVKRAQAILRREEFFVALVDKEKVFKNLIDRKAYLEQLAAHVGDSLDEIK